MLDEQKTRQSEPIMTDRFDFETWLLNAKEEDVARWAKAIEAYYARLDSAALVEEQS